MKNNTILFAKLPIFLDLHTHYRFLHFTSISSVYNGLFSDQTITPIMFRTLVIFCLWGSICCAFASSLYQVDMIVFTHNQNQQSSIKESTIPPILMADDKNTISLKPYDHHDARPFRLLPASTSLLQNEYWTLHHKPQYNVLLHYTWLQPINNQKTITLPLLDHAGWNVEGTIHIKKGTYYSLNTELLFKSPYDKQNTFVFSQQQQLKPGLTYYLDDPNAGMLIKIHPIA